VALYNSGTYASTETWPVAWYWLTTRSYDPALERFLQPDPSALDGVRSYTYCHDDPIDCADPSGLVTQSTGPEPDPGVPTQLRLFPEEPGAATGSGGAGVDVAAADGAIAAANGGEATTPDAVTVELVYEHEINAGEGTYLRELADQIQGQIDGLNNDLGGVKG